MPVETCGQMTLGRWLPSARRGSRHTDGERLAALECDDRRDGPTADDAVHEAIHVAADPAIAADRNVDDRSKDKAVRRIVGADGVLEIEAIELLRIAEVEAADEGVEADRRIVGRFRKRVVPFEADVVVGALLKANLKRVIPGVGTKVREALEGAVELRIRTQQVDERDSRQIVGRGGLVEDCGRALEIGQERIGDRAEEIVADVVAGGIVRRIHCADTRLASVSTGDEVAIARAGIAAPRQVRAAIGGVVDADGDLSGEQALDAEVPLEDVGVVRFLGAEVVAVVVAPVGERTVLVALRLSRCPREMDSRASRIEWRSCRW